MLKVGTTVENNDVSTKQDRYWPKELQDKITHMHIYSF